jgi:hypothetical protein
VPATVAVPAFQFPTLPSMVPPSLSTSVRGTIPSVNVATALLSPLMVTRETHEGVT